MNSIQIVTLITAVIDAVKLIENMMPDSAGKDKLDAVLALVEKLFGPVTDLLPKVAGIVSLTVSTFNTLGIFKKSTPAR